MRRLPKLTNFSGVLSYSEIRGGIGTYLSYFYAIHIVHVSRTHRVFLRGQINIGGPEIAIQGSWLGSYMQKQVAGLRRI
jgi:hypothetical protein